eukprot:403358880
MQKFAQFQLFSPKQISDFKNLDNFQNILKQKQPKDQIQTEQSTYLEGLISPKIGVNIRRKIKPSQMRYQNATSIPNLQSKQYIEDERTVRGPGYYEPSYSLTKMHYPEIEFNSENKLKKQRSKSKLMKYESTQPINKIQKEQIKSFLQDLICKNNPNQERSIASLSQDIYKSLNAKNSENKNQYVFKSLQPQQQQLDQWKVEIPGPGHYNINQIEIQSQINSNRSKVRDFDKQTQKNNTLHYSIDSPFHLVSNLYTPSSVHYFDQKQLKNQSRSTKNSNMLKRIIKFASSKNSNSKQEQDSIDELDEDESFNFLNSKTNLNDSSQDIKESSKQIYNMKSQSPTQSRNISIESQNVNNLGPGQYNPKILNKAGKGSTSSVSFKSKIDRFKTIMPTTHNVQLDQLQYSSFSPKDTNLTSPSFRSMTKRTIVFETQENSQNEQQFQEISNSQTNLNALKHKQRYNQSRNQANILQGNNPEYYSISHKLPLIYVSHQEIRSHTLQVNSPFLSGSPRFEKCSDSPDIKEQIYSIVNQQRKTKETNLGEAIDVRTINTERKYK